MKRCVILDAWEWDKLPILLANEILEGMRDDNGLVLAHKPTGKPYNKPREWLIGTLVLALAKVAKEENR